MVQARLRQPKKQRLIDRHQFTDPLLETQAPDIVDCPAELNPIRRLACAFFTMILRDLLPRDFGGVRIYKGYSLKDRQTAQAWCDGGEDVDSPLNVDHIAELIGVAPKKLHKAIEEAKAGTLSFWYIDYCRELKHERPEFKGL